MAGNPNPQLVLALPVTFAKLLIKGKKSQIWIHDLRIDPEAFFTTLPSEILFDVGALPESLKVRLQFDHDSCVESEVYSLVVMAHGREDVSRTVNFDGARPVLGAKFLEGLGLRVDSESGTLKPLRHRGFDLYYEP